MTVVPPSQAAPHRRPDLDALRVGAFLLLILYHLGMFYVPWGWHVKSSHVVPALAPWMGAVNPWRLTLLFVISGAATRFMASGMGSVALTGRRSGRLLIPLVFGMLVVVPPQSWAQVMEQQGYAGSYLQFWGRYLSFDQSFGIILPTYNHLWFVAYLWLYTMLAFAGRGLAPAADRLAGRLLAGAGLFLVPALVFGVYRATAGRAWGETLVIWADGYDHLQYGTAFLLGLVLARQDGAWPRLQHARFATLIAAAVMLGIGTILSGRMEHTPGWPGIAFAFLREAYAWCVICTLFGFARRYVTRRGRWLAALSDAVFPAYLIHQTTIVLAGHFMKPLGLPILAEAAVLLLLTVASCVAAYSLALAAPPLRPLLGMRPWRPQSRSGAPSGK